MVSLSKTKALNRYKSRVKDKDKDKVRDKARVKDKVIKSTTRPKAPLEQSTMPRRRMTRPLT